MNATDLAGFIAAHGIAAEIVHLQDDTPTVESAARALGVQPDQIVKSILLLADESPVLVIASGTARIDLKRVAEYLKLARKRLKMADAPAMLEIAGYAVGTMPPFGHKAKLRTLIDRRVFEQAEVFGGGGEIDALLRLTPAELARVTGGETVDVIQENEQ